MSQARDKKWQRFEDLVAHIQRTLAPGAIVEQNVKLLGKRSGVERDIDTVVRQKAGQYDLFVAIECKDYKRRVDVKAVESFIGMVADVGANKGAMVAPNGFTEAARTRARNAGIELYTLVDAQAHEWQTYVTIPVVVEDSSIDTFTLTFSTTGQFRLPSQDLGSLVLYRADGSRLGVVRDLISQRWNDETIPHEPGEHRNIALADDPTHVLTEGVLYPIDVRANVTASKTLYFGHLPLDEVQGFADELSGGLITRSLTTAPLDFADMHEEWQVVEAIDDLAVKPVLTLVVSSSYTSPGDEPGAA